MSRSQYLYMEDKKNFHFLEDRAEFPTSKMNIGPAKQTEYSHPSIRISEGTKKNSDQTQAKVDHGGETKYLPLDVVLLRAGGEGPYLIEGIKDGKYLLCDENGGSVRNGYLFEEGDLIPFNSSK